MDKDEIRAQPKFELLLEENVDKFNQLVKAGKAPDMKNANLSGLDLRKAHLRGLNLTGCYMRATNLRGVDMTGCNLFGASMQGAMISGALFPSNVPMDEIRLSVEYGTRIRTLRMGDDLKKIMSILGEIHELLLNMN